LRFNPSFLFVDDSPQLFIRMGYRTRQNAGH
jgi:hypothetical protein